MSHLGIPDTANLCYFNCHRESTRYYLCVDCKLGYHQECHPNHKPELKLPFRCNTCVNRRMRGQQEPVVTDPTPTGPVTRAASIFNLSRVQALALSTITFRRNIEDLDTSLNPWDLSTDSNQDENSHPRDPPPFVPPSTQEFENLGMPKESVPSLAIEAAPKQANPPAEPGAQAEMEVELMPASLPTPEPTPETTPDPISESQQDVVQQSEKDPETEKQSESQLDATQALNQVVTQASQPPEGQAEPQVEPSTDTELPQERAEQLRPELPAESEPQAQPDEPPAEQPALSPNQSTATSDTEIVPPATNEEPQPLSDEPAIIIEEEPGTSMQHEPAPPRVPGPSVRIRQTRRRMTRSSLIPRQEEAFEVDEIIAHDKLPNKHRELQFRVRFRDYEAEDDLWFDETKIPECYELIQSYRLLNNLGPTGLPTPINTGFTQQMRVASNPNNWIPFTKIPDLIKKYNNKTYPRSIPVEIFKKLGDHDTIYVIQFAAHALAGIYYAANKDLYIADGPNAITDSKYYQVIECLVGSKFTPVRVLGQNRADHCATSAALIAMEFMRIYGNNQLMPSQIKLPKWRTAAMVKANHKETSERITNWKPIQQNVPVQKCSKCDKTFKSNNGSKFVNHQRLCRGNK